MSAIEDIQLKSEPKTGTILNEFCDNLTSIPTGEGKRFFADGNGRVPGKLIRQCIFACIYWAKAHPDDIVIMEAKQ